MDSFNTLLNAEVQKDSCGQGCSVCAGYHPVVLKDAAACRDNARQLYAKESEDYFFYFIPEHRTPEVAVSVDADGLLQVRVTENA